MSPLSPSRSTGLAARLSRRRAGATLLGVAALAFVALSPAAASADGGATIAISGSLCESVAAAATPENCPSVPVDGDIQIVSEDGSIVLAKGDSTLHGANSVWGESGDLPYGLYFIDHSGMQVPAGYQLQNYVALMGDTGGSEFGLYANTSASLPNAHLDFVFVPFQVDSDGDGASDEAENDFGSDPNDPSDFPAGQAGGDPSGDADSDGDTLSDAEEIEIYATDPYSTDTDGDGVSDYDEVWAGIDPLDPNVYPGSGPADAPEADSDGDGADDTIEAAYGSDPSDATDHPRPTSAEGTSAAVTQATVTQLPNTGAGGSADGSLGSIIAATLGAAALAIFGAVANRRRA